MPGYTDFRMKEGTECIIVISQDDKPARWLQGELVTGNPNGRANCEVQAKVSPFVLRRDLEGIADENRMMNQDITYYVFPVNQSMQWLLGGIELLKQEMEQMRNDPAVRLAAGARDLMEKIRGGLPHSRGER